MDCDAMTKDAAMTLRLTTISIVVTADVRVVIALVVERLKVILF